MKLKELTNKIEFEDILEKYNYDWKKISLHEYLSEEFMNYYKDKLNWEIISEYQRLSESFIEKYKDYVDWYWISSTQKLSELFIVKFPNLINCINWDCISMS